MVFLVEVEERKIKKAYLGGWRNKHTGIEYLNALSQTGPPPKILRWDCYCSRKTQSVETTDKNTQPFHHQTTQMWRDDCYIPSVSDKYMTAKPYESHEDIELRLNKDGHIRTIQRYYRAYRISKYIKECAAAYRKKVSDCKQHDDENAVINRRRHQREILRKTYPATRSDFAMLYNMIDTWKLALLERTKVNFFQGAQRAANSSILEKTVQMLRDIDKHRSLIREDHAKRQSIRFLTTNCRPISWNGYKGRPIEMVTLKVQKAREFKNIHDSLRKGNSSVEERLEILLMLKNSLKTHNCYAVNELVYLLDQEIALLTRGMRNLLLTQLRRRLISAYLYFVSVSHTCTCRCDDKSSSKDTGCEELREPIETNKLLCRSCFKLLPYKRFSSYVRMKKLRYCTGCMWLPEGKNARINYDPYTFLLNEVRENEQKRNCFSSLAFIIQARGFYHLVNSIWHGRSIVSENDDVFALRLVRFVVDEEWAPWNCILLTKEEAETHYYIKDFETVYSKHLLSKIALAHEQALNRFRDLLIFEKNFRVSSRYYMVQNRKEYKSPSAIEDYNYMIKEPN